MRVATLSRLTTARPAPTRRAAARPAATPTGGCGCGGSNSQPSGGCSSSSTSSSSSQPSAVAGGRALPLDMPPLSRDDIAAAAAAAPATPSADQGERVVDVAAILRGEWGEEDADLDAYVV